MHPVRFPLSFLAGVSVVFGLSHPATARQPDNDDFHR